MNDKLYQPEHTTLSVTDSLRAELAAVTKERDTWKARAYEHIEVEAPALTQICQIFGWSYEGNHIADALALKAERDGLVIAALESTDPLYVKPATVRAAVEVAQSVLATRDKAHEAKGRAEGLSGWTAERLAQTFHETYERMAPVWGYKTREASAKPWAEVPENNKGLMIATCAAILDRMAGAEAKEGGDA